MGEMETEARRLSKSSRSRTTPRRQRTNSSRFFEVSHELQEALTTPSHRLSPRRPDRTKDIFPRRSNPRASSPPAPLSSTKPFSTKGTIIDLTQTSASSNSRDVIDLTGNDPTISTASRALFHGEQPAQDRLFAMNRICDSWRY